MAGSSEAGKDGLKEKRSAMMVVSVLIATLTYQASLNPPGGFWQDAEHRAGTAVNANLVGFKWFMIANTVGLFASLTNILLLTMTSAVTIRRQIMMWVLMVMMWVSVFSVAFSFFCGVGLVIVGELSDLAVEYIIVFGLGCMVLFFVLVLLQTLIDSKRSTAG